MKPRRPCDVCARIHPGGPCKPHETRRVQVDVGLPAGVFRKIREHVPFGERSRWMADAIEQRLAEETS